MRGAAGFFTGPVLPCTHTSAARPHHQTLYVDLDRRRDVGEPVIANNNNNK